MLPTHCCIMYFSKGHLTWTMETVRITFISLKTALVLALMTAKCLSDLKTPPFLFAVRLTMVWLRPSSAYVPVVVESTYRYPTVKLLVFHPSQFSSMEEQRLNTVCPGQTLHVYVSRTAGFEIEDILRVLPISRQRLSHPIMEVVCLAYRCRALSPMRGMATSWLGYASPFCEVWQARCIGAFLGTSSAILK